MSYRQPPSTRISPSPYTRRRGSPPPPLYCAEHGMPTGAATHTTTSPPNTATSNVQFSLFEAPPSSRTTSPRSTMSRAKPRPPSETSADDQPPVSILRPTKPPVDVSETTSAASFRPPSTMAVSLNADGAESELRMDYTALDTQQQQHQLNLPSAMSSTRRSKKSGAKATLKRSFSLVPERFADVERASKNANKFYRRRSPMLWCETLMKAASIVLFVLTLPVSLLVCLRVIAQYQRAVIFRLGRLMSQDARGPGLVFLLPCLDTLKKIDLRTFTFDVPTQEVLTKDSVTVAMEAVVYYRIFDPVMSVVNVEDANRSTRLLAQTTLRNVLGTVDLYTLLTEREEIASMMQETLDVATDTWGVKVERVEVKDVRLPTQLQRAMAAEAEATREAKAKVIAARGEQLASRALKEAAIELSECPIAIQLRYLQTLNSISAEKNSTIIFPLPLDLLQTLNKKRSKKSKKHTEALAKEDGKPPSAPPYEQTRRRKHSRSASTSSSASSYASPQSREDAV